MSAQQDDQFRQGMGTAALIACVVQTLNESDSTFQERFLNRLERAYREFPGRVSGDPRIVLEMFAATRELLTGYSPLTGKGKPFLEY